MKQIPLNNSSLEDMACTRRYVYRVVLGAVVPPEIKLRYGKLFHAYMEHITDDDVSMFMAPVMGSNNFGPKWATPVFTELRKDISDTIQMQLAMWACHVRDLLGDSLRQGKREGFFRGTYDHLRTVDLVGTIDLIHYDTANQLAVISDYKTTGKPISAATLLLYQLKSQLFFYATVKRMLLPKDRDLSPLELAIFQGRIGRRYILINYTAKTPDAAIHVGAVDPIHQDVLAEFEQLIHEKAALASFLHQHPDLSTKDGMSNGACYFCPYKQVCALNNPGEEKRAIERWPYGFAPYDPETF
jgi:hypothetical protein